MLDYSSPVAQEAGGAFASGRKGISGLEHLEGIGGEWLKGRARGMGGGHLVGWLADWLAGEMDGWIGGWMGEWMGGWMLDRGRDR